MALCVVIHDNVAQIKNIGTGYNWISYAVGLLTFPTVALANCICACALYRLAAPRLGLPLPDGCTPSVEHEVLDQAAAAERAAAAAASAASASAGAGGESQWQRVRSLGTSGSTGADGYRLTAAFRAKHAEGGGISGRQQAQNAWESASARGAAVGPTPQAGATSQHHGAASGVAGGAGGDAANNGGGAAGAERKGLLARLVPWKRGKGAGASVAPAEAAAAASATAAAEAKAALPRKPSAFRRAVKSALHVCAVTLMSCASDHSASAASNHFCMVR